MDGARADTDEVLEIAHATGDTTLRAKALTVRGEIDQRDGAYEASALTLSEAVRLWKEVGDRHGEAEALRLWGFTSMYQGNNDAAENAITEALEISRELKDSRGEAWALQNLAWAAFSRGDIDLAEERLLASAQRFEEIGDFGGRAWAYGLLGYVWYFKGRLDEAATVAEGGLEISREIGDRWAYGMMLNLLVRRPLVAGPHAPGARLRAPGVPALHRDRRQHGPRLRDDGARVDVRDDGLGRGSARARDARDADRAAGVRRRLGGRAHGGAHARRSSATSRRRVGSSTTHPEVERGVGHAHDARARRLRRAATPRRRTRASSKAWASADEDPGERANYGCIFALAAAAAGASGRSDRAPAAR